MTQRKSRGAKRSIVKELLQWAAAFIAAIAAALLINNFVIVNAQIPSSSMEDTIMPGDRVFGNRLAYVLGEPERFDIIIFRYPDDESQLFIKRIIGLPGETVEIRDGHIYINGSDTPLEDVETKEPMEGPLVLTPYLKTAILSWETIATTPGTPATGNTPSSLKMRYWEKQCSATGRSIR